MLLLPLSSKTLFNCSGDRDDTPQMSSQTDEEKFFRLLADGEMKIVIMSSSPNASANLFYVRAGYNADNDLIQLFYQNSNGIISPKAVYMGSKSMRDENIMTEPNLMVKQQDSTAPLFGVDAYWHLYAQHGYCVPIIGNTNGMTQADLGARWIDQMGREYTVGNVSSTDVILLPVIYKDEKGHYTRGWKTPQDPAITNMTHVSGGVATTDITLYVHSYLQLYPIMKSENRMFVVDGKRVNSAGTYYGQQFYVSEEQIGYDPATIKSWFPAARLDDAEALLKYTWSYHFCGVQCNAQTTIDILREVECQCFGATQQQTFYDRGDYKAMFMIPKAAPRNGVEIDKPFNSPSASSTGYYFTRTAQHLKDVNQPIDRIIAYLHNDATQDDLFGMAAGLSLVSGDTQTEKRLENIPVGNANTHYRIGSFSPVNTNKFYISAINTAPFAGQDYHLSPGYHKDINYYVCFFDPKENPGQVYWYQEGDDYVIYAHCQDEHQGHDIHIPTFMNGRSLRVVEKTDGTELLSSTISNGTFTVNYLTNDANYIVLIAE